MQEAEERQLLGTIAQGGPEAWEIFLRSFSGVVFRVACQFARSHDDRMDLFLEICSRLKDGGMRRIRAFRHRPEAPCRLSTWLAVVARNIAVDLTRAKEGRFRLYRCIGAMEEIDRLVFEYHVRDGLAIEEVRGILLDRHGIHVSPSEAWERAGKVWAALSPAQRWKIVSRLYARREQLPLEDVAEETAGADGSLPLRGGGGDPEGPLRSEEAARTLKEAMEGLPPRQRLTLVLKYRDGLSSRDIATVLGSSTTEAERLVREGLKAVRERVRESKISRPDLESASLSGVWSK